MSLTLSQRIPLKKKQRNVPSKTILILDIEIPPVTNKETLFNRRTKAAYTPRKKVVYMRQLVKLLKPYADYFKNKKILKAEIVFYFARPKYLKQLQQENLYLWNKADNDNLLKPFQDALQEARVIDNDKYLVQTLCHKVYCRAGQKPGIRAKIELCNPILSLSW